MITELATQDAKRDRNVIFAEIAAQLWTSDSNERISGSAIAAIVNGYSLDAMMERLKAGDLWASDDNKPSPERAKAIKAYREAYTAAIMPLKEVGAL
ncbi:MAG TPA: hypothetical protein VGI19_14575 [Candidatus Cybelea sp.]|jgi:hypothetical protein